MNLANIPIKRDWVSRAEDIIKNEKKYKESRKVRKKRLWLERKEGKGIITKKKSEKHYGDWGNLPDLCLEIIFQYLPFDVSYCISKKEKLKLGLIADPVIEAIARLEFEDGLRTGVLPGGCWGP